jgi:hypothetical protein
VELSRCRTRLGRGWESDGVTRAALVWVGLVRHIVVVVIMLMLLLARRTHVPFWQRDARVNCHFLVNVHANYGVQAALCQLWRRGSWKKRRGQAAHQPRVTRDRSAAVEGKSTDRGNHHPNHSERGAPAGSNTRRTHQWTCPALGAEGERFVGWQDRCHPQTSRLPATEPWRRLNSAGGHLPRGPDKQCALPVTADCRAEGAQS